MDSAKVGAMKDGDAKRVLSADAVTHFEFVRVPLRFDDGTHSGVFAQKNNKTLEQTLAHRRYAGLAHLVLPGLVGLARGHALVLYDARNPAFQAGGEADRQWEATIAACLVPGLLRRLTWQRLLTFIATVPDLAWLVDALRDKYALLPE